MLSIELVKSVHSAFLKFMKVFLLSNFVCFSAMKVVVRMGRWSDESCFRVVQLELFVK